jgi:translation initiation factor eIF-2B subunit epsilon
LDREQLLKGDFILVGSDFVSNADLTSCLSQHKIRRKSDSEFILTKVFKSVPFTSRLRTSADQVVVTLHKDEIVQIEDMGDSNKFECASDFSKLSECETRFDLLDANVSICTPELLSRFTDNFDYHTLEQVMKELLTNDVYTDKVAAYVLPPHFYLSRAQDPRTYDAITKDVLSRWAYPIVLNNNLLPRSTPTTYTCQLSNLYREEGVKVSYTASVTPPSAIGTRTVISDKAIVTKSVIGRDCKIGVGAVVEESYIWDSVVIEDGARISHSIICSGCIIGAESNIQQGSILATGTVVSEHTVIGPNTRLSREATREVSSKVKIGNAYVHWGEGVSLDEDKQQLAEEQSIGGTLHMWTEDDNWETDSSSSEIDTDIKYDEAGNPISLEGHPECNS